MKKILLILFTLLLFSCSSTTNKVAVYKPKAFGYGYLFYYNNSFHGQHNRPQNDILKDSISIYYNEFCYDDTVQNFDSVWLSNSMPGLTQGKGIEYVAKLSHRKMIFYISYPYKLNGSYSAALSADEYKLLTGMISEIADELKSNQQIDTDIINNNQPDVGQALFFRSFRTGKKFTYYGNISSREKNAAALNEYMMVLIKEKITVSPKNQRHHLLKYIQNVHYRYAEKYSNVGMIKGISPPAFDTTFINRTDEIDIQIDSLNKSDKK